MGKELRRYQRIPADLKTELGGQLADLAPVEIRLINLSADGVGFLCSRKLVPGEIMEFTVPLGRPIHAKAQVLWSQPHPEGFRHGARFVEMTPDDKRALAGYVHMQINALGLEPLEGDRD